MRTFITLILLFPFYSFSQTSGLIKDKSTGKAISYANIWVENENIGTTSNFEGNFRINENIVGKYLVISAVGYERQKVKIESSHLTVNLTPKVYELGEIVVKQAENSNKIILGEFDKSEIHHYYGCNNKPWIIAKLVKYEKRFEKTPFLKELTLLSNSGIKSATFNLRFLIVDSIGAPDNDILSEPVLIDVKKGNKITNVNLSKYYIEIPKEGLFIAIDWLIIDRNKKEYEYQIPNSEETVSRVRYEPLIGTVPAENNECSWIYRNGNWNKAESLPESMPIKDYVGKFPQLAFTLVLTD